MRNIKQDLTGTLQPQIKEDCSLKGIGELYQTLTGVLKKIKKKEGPSAQEKQGERGS